jgi:Kiwa protein KwaB-like
MPALDELLAFDLDGAAVTFWTFKGPRGLTGTDPSYMGRWVDTTDDVDRALKDIVGTERGRIEEVLEYGLLAQNHETSALTITTEETHAGLLVDESAAETQQRKIFNVKHLRNANFYVAKLILGETVIHAVRKTEPGWKTKKALSKRSVFFRDDELDVDDRPHFELAKSIDFFIVGDEILCLHKGHMESVLRYKETHKEDFQALQDDPEFAGIFVNIAPLVTHVGENKIKLRRASAIRQKEHYKDEAFMDRLRERQAQYGFTIQFDNQGRIIATAETCSQIITALLDHRLASGFSERVYDVPSTTPIAL